MSKEHELKTNKLKPFILLTGLTEIIEEKSALVKLHRGLQHIKPIMMTSFYIAFTICGQNVANFL